MKLFNRLLRPAEQRNSLTDSEFVRLLTGGATAAGVVVTPESALSSTAVLAAVRVLSESIASLPLIVYRRDGRAKERAPEHPLYRILHDTPNPEITAYSLRRLQVAHMALYGNAYSEVEWSPSGQVMGLWPLHPSRVGIERDKATGALQYTYWSDKGGGAVLPAHRVFHLRWLESDGIVGQSPIRLAANAVGLGLAMEEFGASYFANGARPSVILKHPGVLKPEAYERLRASFANTWAGLSNAHRVQILEEGIDVTTVGVPPEEAQLLEARKFQVDEIARMFRLPPHLLGSLERATFSNVEFQGIEFLQYTLTPMLVSLEQEIRRQLMTPSELGTFDVEHVVDGLLRGDSKSRYDVYVRAINNGIMSVNEVRALENLNPVENGDAYYMPLNLAPLGTQQQGEQQPQEAPVAPETDKPAAPTDDTRFAPLYKDVAQRIVRREVNDLRRAIDKYLRKRGSASEFVAYLDEFYRDLAGDIPTMYRALIEVVGSEAGNEQVSQVLEYTKRNQQELTRLVQGEAEGDPATAAEEWLSELAQQFGVQASRG